MKLMVKVANYKEAFQNLKLYINHNKDSNLLFSNDLLMLISDLESQLKTNILKSDDFEVADSEPLGHPMIYEIHLIEKDSGLIKGAFEPIDVVDNDMVAGMLTAIKAFMEDAFFDKANVEVGLIDYGEFKILIHPLTNHYIAVILKGEVGLELQQFILSEIIDFKKNYFVDNGSDNHDDSMIKFFTGTCRRLAEKLF